MARGSRSKSKPRPRTTAPQPLPKAELRPLQRRDPRRWIYTMLCLLFAATQAFLIWKVVPNRLPSASFHLWTVPIFTFVMGAATARGGQYGWYVAVFAGSAALLSTVLLIVRIIISAAFLSGVYGAFGKAAAMTALTSVALLVELCALLPIVQVKWLMTRAGRRTLGARES
ncbi:MAG: hypothetical protein H0T46_20760 [Deltaproteobacteria bacterium]|nr:hypothetical protein [Deltaproteobacteria bacterium]